MKTVLVTGGNRGIGLEICRQLSSMGHQVIMGSREIEKGQVAAKKAGLDITVRELDVTSEESIWQLYESINLEFKKVDVLINNAGIGEISYRKDESILYKTKVFMEKNIPGVSQINKKIVPLLRKTGLVTANVGVQNVSISSAKAIMETNFYGVWRMIQVFLPLLEKSEQGRIINISSGMGELANLDGSYPGYRLSKVALNALTIMYAKDLDNKGIKVNAVCPGWVKTDMGGINAPKNVSEGADTAVWLATEPQIPTGKFFRDRKVISW